MSETWRGRLKERSILGNGEAELDETQHFFVRTPLPCDVDISSTNQILNRISKTSMEQYHGRMSFRDLGDDNLFIFIQAVAHQASDQECDPGLAPLRRCA